MKSTSGEPRLAAWIGIDWADRTHAWSLAVPGVAGREQGKLAHTPEAIEAWVQGLIRRFAGEPVAVCLEQSRGALLFCLSKYPQLVLYPIHPATAKSYRQAVYPSGRKSDPVDADLLREYLETHRDRLRVWRPDDEQTRELQFLVEDRRRLVDQRTAGLLQLQQRLKMYFPQVLGWFGAIDSALLWDVLARWPDLASLQAAGRAALARRLPQDKRRRAPVLAELWPAIQRAVPATHDAAVVRSATRLVQALVRRLQLEQAIVRDYETRIDELTRAHPDYALMNSFPGVGQALAPRLIAAVGTDRARFENAGQLQSYSGVAPVEQASGKSRQVRVRRACPTFIRQTFVEWAHHSITHCPWARAFYEEQRTRKRHPAALRALAFKWIRIFYRCWRTGKFYDEALCLAQRASRAHPKSVQKRCTNRTAFSHPG